MNAILAAANGLDEVSSGYGALIKIGLFVLIAIGVFVWWLKRQT
jgi:hypothetical protein